MKRFLAMLLLASMALCIMGCDANRETGEGQAASSSQAETESGQADSLSSSESGEGADEDSGGDAIELSALAEREPDHTHDSTYVLLGDIPDRSVFDACAGDLITVEVENTAGSLDLTIRVDDEVLYDQKEIKEESCVLEVGADGRCVITVVGHMASGHFTINHYAMNSDGE